MTRVHHPPPAATSLSSIGRSICQAYAGVNALPSTAQPRPELEVNRVARAPRRATLRDVGVAGSNPVTPTIESKVISLTKETQLNLLRCRSARRFSFALGD